MTILSEDHEVSAQAAQFFLAGYETTSSTVTFALYEIASNQDVQDKLREEINNNLNDEEEFSYNAIMSMCYLHKVALGNGTPSCMPLIVHLYKFTFQKLLGNTQFCHFLAELALEITRYQIVMSLLRRAHLSLFH